MRLLVFLRRRTRRAWALLLPLAAGLFLLPLGRHFLLQPEPPPEGLPERRLLAGRLIALDAGHGGIDGGCSVGPVLEKDLTLDIVLHLRTLLQSQGARVFLTREGDHDLSRQGEGSFRQRRDLSGRVSLVSRAGAEVLVSVHVNSARNSRLSGPITFHQGQESQGRESRRLGGLVQEELCRLYPGCVERTWPQTFYLLRNAPCPTTLVEVGYLSHPADRLRLIDPLFRRHIAAAIAAALRRYFAGDSPCEPNLRAAD